MSVVAFAIASGFTLSNLEAEIGRLIGEGYQPCDGASIRPDGNGFVGFPMVKHDALPLFSVEAVKLPRARHLKELEGRVAALISDGWQPLPGAGIQADNDGFIAFPVGKIVSNFSVELAEDDGDSAGGEVSAVDKIDSDVADSDANTGAESGE